MRYSQAVEGCENRRGQSERRPLQLQVDGRSFYGYTMDISETGLRVLARGKLTPGELVSFCLELGDRVLCLGGRVVWANLFDRSVVAGIALTRDQIDGYELGRYLYR